VSDTWEIPSGFVEIFWPGNYGVNDSAGLFRAELLQNGLVRGVAVHVIAKVVVVDSR